MFRKIASGLHGYGHANVLTYDDETYTFERCYEQDEVWCFEFVGAGARLIAEQYHHGYLIVLVEPMG